MVNFIFLEKRDNAKERKMKVKNRRSEVINMGRRITREERY